MPIDRFPPLQKQHAANSLTKGVIDAVLAVHPEYISQASDQRFIAPNSYSPYLSDPLLIQFAQNSQDKLILGKPSGESEPVILRNDGSITHFINAQDRSESGKLYKIIIIGRGSAPYEPGILSADGTAAPFSEDLVAYYIPEQSDSQGHAVAESLVLYNPTSLSGHIFYVQLRQNQHELVTEVLKRITRGITDQSGNASTVKSAVATEDGQDRQQKESDMLALQHNNDLEDFEKVNNDFNVQLEKKSQMLAKVTEKMNYFEQMSISYRNQASLIQNTVIQVEHKLDELQKEHAQKDKQCKDLCEENNQLRMKIIQSDHVNNNSDQVHHVSPESDQTSGAADKQRVVGLESVPMPHHPHAYSSP